MPSNRINAKNPIRLYLRGLEARNAPATLVNPTQLTYQDIDGDNVTVSLTRPIPAVTDISTVFVFENGFAAGDNSIKQKLQRIDLTSFGNVVAGTMIKTVATASKTNGGDGYAHVGFINATGIDLGLVTIDGDLGKIVAGDADAKTPGLKSLTAQSMGAYGASTGAPDLISSISGQFSLLKVKSDIRESQINSSGNIGSVSIGGSLIGGALDSSGRIHSVAGSGPVTILGDIVGGNGLNCGAVTSDGKITSIRVGGSVFGGSSEGTGRIAASELGNVIVGGSVIGGDGLQSGNVHSTGNLAGVTIGGSLAGGFGNFSGRISSDGGMGALKIAGDVAGVGMESGVIASGGNIASARIGGSLTGGIDSFSGRIVAEVDIKLLAITGDMIGGSATGNWDLQESGNVRAARILNMTIGGSLIAGVDDTSGLFANNGAIRVDGDIASLMVKGSLRGNATNPAIITAVGSAVPSATTDVAIGRLTVLGRAEFAKIIVGVDSTDAFVNADAQIGAVSVRGDWIASSIVAGVVSTNGFFGDGDDVKIAGVDVKDEDSITSKIGSVTIGGQILGSLAGGDHFGIVAEVVGAVKVGDFSITLAKTDIPDDFSVGATSDFRIKEV